MKKRKIDNRQTSQPRFVWSLHTSTQKEVRKEKREIKQGIKEGTHSKQGDTRHQGGIIERTPISCFLSLSALQPVTLFQHVYSEHRALIPTISSLPNTVQPTHRTVDDQTPRPPTLAAVFRSRSQSAVRIGPNDPFTLKKIYILVH